MTILPPFTLMLTIYPNNMLLLCFFLVFLWKTKGEILNNSPQSIVIKKDHESNSYTICIKIKSLVKPKDLFEISVVHIRCAPIACQLSVYTISVL